MSIFDLPADHEARGIAKIVSKGRPQAVRTANRIARAKKLGSADYTRFGTRGAGPSATKKVESRRGEAGARNSQILTRLGESNTVNSFDGWIRCRDETSYAGLSGPSARLAPATIRSPRVGVNIGLVSLKPET